MNVDMLEVWPSGRFEARAPGDRCLFFLKDFFIGLGYHSGERAHPRPGPLMPMGYTHSLRPISDPLKGLSGHRSWGLVSLPVIPRLRNECLGPHGTQTHFPDWVATGPPWGASPGLRRDLGRGVLMCGLEEARFILCKTGGCLRFTGLPVGQVGPVCK